MNLPNKLTFTRIAIVPFFILSVELGGFGWSIVALILFIAASLTDFFDGRIARRTNTITSLGIFLDPLADKLLVSSAFILFVQFDQLGIPAWMVIAIIAREFLITGFRTLAVSKNVIIPADKSGKFKTTSQIVVIIIILLIMIVREGFYKFTGAVMQVYDLGTYETLSFFFDKAPFWAVLIVVLLTLYSGANYLLKHKNLLKE
ncbi:MAG: CDP-diacylglycerol--glycerol-3-phosphate 3-phosphatidyltransferase [Elusimicrobiota bacterium]|jgi:CDP-diacylglycerol--glycerol-3-phosphate 3-phosphatidyltransferase|nr:CDP-diacylglycerol--glycerol-3-phosphate 3-phosphatidyltransferase [Elusimicrobiota bacterium]